MTGLQISRKVLRWTSLVFHPTSNFTSPFSSKSARSSGALLIEDFPSLSSTFYSSSSISRFSPTIQILSINDEAATQKSTISFQSISYQRGLIFCHQSSTSPRLSSPDLPDVFSPTLEEWLRSQKLQAFT